MVKQLSLFNQPSLNVGKRFKEQLALSAKESRYSRDELIRWRDKLIKAEYDEGKTTVVRLARKYNLSDRQMYNILGEKVDKTRQLKLF